MAIVPKEILKLYFESGDRPTAAQFASLIDSNVNILSDRYLVGLREYDPAKQYLTGDTTIFNHSLYECLADTTGAFVPMSWRVITSLGAVVFVGLWDAIANDPTLESGQGVKGAYYIVSNASAIPSENTMLDGIDDWGITDWVIFDGITWNKVDNSNSPVTAADVIFTPNGDITATNTQDAVVEVRDDTDAKLSLKADKVDPAIDGNFAGLDATGNLTDSTFNSGSFLPAGTVAADIPFAPNTTILSDNVQDAIDELTSDLENGLDEKLNLTGGTLTGDLILNADPAVALGAATKQYVDAGLDTKLDLDGGTMLGDLVLNEDPTLDLGAATKQYVDNGLADKLDLAGGTMAGPLTLFADPVEALEAATKQYVDDTVGTGLADKLDIAGGTMTGDLVLNADPTLDLGAATKQYVDNGLGDKLDIAGGTMTGDLILNADPTLDLGATTKQYVDDNLAGGLADKLNITGGTLTGDLILNADPTLDLGATTKQYVDNNLATGLAAKLNLSGGTLTGSLLLNADPSASLEAATKHYVDSAVSGVPAQVKVMAMPFTFTTIYSFNSGNSSNWGRIPIQIGVPVATDVFPSTSISAQIFVTYSTSGTAAGMKVALLDYTDYAGGTITNAMIVSGSSSSLAGSTSYTSAIGSAFSLTGGKSFCILIQRTAGTVNIESATLVLTYS